MGNERLTICFELLQKLRARLESRLTWLKLQYLQVLCIFAPELNCFSRTPVLYLCSHRLEIENNSILAEFFPFSSISPDLIFIGFQPVSLRKGYTFFLTSHVMHMNAFVTFVHAGLDGTSRLSVHFRTRKHSWNLFQQNRNNSLIKSKSFWKI